MNSKSWSVVSLDVKIFQQNWYLDIFISIICVIKYCNNYQSRRFRSHVFHKYSWKKKSASFSVLSFFQNSLPLCNYRLHLLLWLTHVQELYYLAFVQEKLLTRQLLQTCPLSDRKCFSFCCSWNVQLVFEGINSNYAQNIPDLTFFDARFEVRLNLFERDIHNRTYILCPSLL